MCRVEEMPLDKLKVKLKTTVPHCWRKREGREFRFESSQGLEEAHWKSSSL